MTEKTIPPVDDPGDDPALADAASTTATTTSSEKQGLEKPAKTLERLSLLLPYLKPYRSEVIGSAISLIVTAALTLAIGPTLSYLVDHGFDSAHSNAIDKYFLALGGVVCILGIATVMRSYLVSTLGERVVADLRTDVFSNLVTLTPEFYETNRAGEIASRLTADTSIIQSLVGSSMSVALRNVLLMVGGIIALIFTSWRLSVVVLAMIPIVVVPIIFLGRKVRRLSRLSQDRIADLGTQADEALGAIQTVLAFTAQARETAAFRTTVNDALEIARRRIFVRAILTGLVIFLVFGGVDLVLWMGARDVVTGSMSSGVLTQFIFFAIIAASASGALSEVYGDMLRAAGATARLVELATAPPTVVDPQVPTRLPAAKGRVEFRKIRFHYPSRPTEAALYDFSLTIEPGERIALVGPSGAGKSTAFQLLLKFYMPQQGEILLDGVSLKDASSHDVREHMALVAQDPVIFAGSVAQNICYGRPDASEKDMLAAAEAAAALEFISRLPQGMETPLGDRGILLSGGERQRLAIARAILRDPPVLLLDEATSALDAHNEQRVQAALDRLMAGRTSLIIAHRLSTVLDCDRIVVMNHGRINAIGTHAELIAQGGLYSELAALQFDMQDNLKRASSGGV